MNIKMLNKRGDKILSVYWFAILLLVAGGIVAMVWIFYGNPYDVRKLEAEIMVNQIADCISDTGRINELIFQKDFQNNFLEECHFNFDVEDEFDWSKNSQYYLEINIYSLEEVNMPIVSFSEGNLNLVSSCEIENENYERLARCVEEKFYSLGENNEQYLIKILSIVRKSEKNVDLK